MPQPNSLSASLFRRLVPLAVALPLAFLLSGCSSHATTAESPAANEVQFTSANGFLTINVPKTWTENTAEAQPIMDDAAGVGTEPPRVEGGWFVSGDSFETGSSVLIVDGGGASDDQAAVANQVFTDFSRALGEATAPYSTLTTRAGLTFERADFVVSDGETTATLIYLVAVVDGVGIVISVTLLNDDVAFEDEVIHAIETLVVN